MSYEKVSLSYEKVLKHILSYFELQKVSLSYKTSILSYDRVIKPHLLCTSVFFLLFFVAFIVFCVFYVNYVFFLLCYDFVLIFFYVCLCLFCDMCKKRIFGCGPRRGQLRWTIARGSVTACPTASCRRKVKGPEMS